MLIRFPQERCSPDARLQPGHLCLILILPVVRIEREPPLLGRRQTRRCRKEIDKLRDPIR